MATACPVVTVIIPTINRLDLLKEAIRSFRKSTDVHYEIVVVDNGNDGTAEWCQKQAVEVLKPEHPLTFGESNNLAAQGRKSEYLLLLNNDTIAHRGFLEAMIETMQAHEKCVMVGAKILRGDKKLSHAGVDFHANGVPYHPFWGEVANQEFFNFDRPVNAVTAACTLVDTIAWNKVHGFDPRYESNYEDVDLCLKFRERGWEIWYSHKAVITHLENQTRGEANDITPMLMAFVAKWIKSGNLLVMVERGCLDLNYVERRVNLGCGEKHAPGYVNIDIAPIEGVDIVRDVTRGLPFDDASVDRIYSKDLLQHLTGGEAAFVLSECARVLRPGATLGVSVELGFTGDLAQHSVWTKDSPSKLAVPGLEVVSFKESRDRKTLTVEFKRP